MPAIRFLALLALLAALVGFIFTLPWLYALALTLGLIPMYVTAVWIGGFIEGHNQ